MAAMGEGHLQGSAGPREEGHPDPCRQQAYRGALERPQAGGQIWVQIQNGPLSYFGLLGDPSPAGTTSAPPSGPSAHPAHQLSGQPHLSASPFPPSPMRTHQLFLTYPYHLTQAPVSRPPGCPYPPTTFHHPLPEPQPDQTLEKAGLTVSFSCPALWAKSSPFHRTRAAASATPRPRPPHFSGLPKVSLCPEPPPTPGLVGVSWPQRHVDFPQEPTDHAVRSPC